MLVKPATAVPVAGVEFMDCGGNWRYLAGGPRRAQNSGPNVLGPRGTRVGCRIAGSGCGNPLMGSATELEMPLCQDPVAQYEAATRPEQAS